MKFIYDPVNVRYQRQRKQTRHKQNTLSLICQIEYNPASHTKKKKRKD